MNNGLVKTSWPMASIWCLPREQDTDCYTTYPVPTPLPLDHNGQTSRTSLSLAARETLPRRIAYASSQRSAGALTPDSLHRCTSPSLPPQARHVGQDDQVYISQECSTLCSLITSSSLQQSGLPLHHFFFCTILPVADITLFTIAAHYRRASLVDLLTPSIPISTRSANSRQHQSPQSFIAQQV
jgi:hypothetical protein